MGFLSQRVEKGDLKAGDHIYTWRIAFAYSHHGIYVGGNKVVHFTSDKNFSSSSDSFSFFSCCYDNCPDWCSKSCKSGVIMSCLDCFLGNDSLYRYQYGVDPLTFLAKLRSGTCTTAKSDPPIVVCYNAMYLLEDGFGRYDLLKNNCEDFALYCKTGFLVSGRVAVGSSGQASYFGLAPSATVGSLALLVITNPIFFAATTASVYLCKRYADDIGVRGDVIKVGVEQVSSFQRWKSN